MDTRRYVNVPRLKKYHEGWMEHKAQGKQWTPYWCVLRGYMIFLFRGTNTSRESIIGTLTINKDSRLEKREGSEQTGYKFELFTANKNNSFRTKKFSERELWKAFVEGLAKGTVPETLDLLPGQIEHVRAELGIGSRPRSMLPADTPAAPPSQNRSRSSSVPALMSYPSGFDSPNSSASGSFSMTEEGEVAVPPEDYVEPAALSAASRHRFHADPAVTEIPRWFFANLSRHLAEKVLTLGERFGNTLMRESPDAQSLVISKRIDRQPNSIFNHFKIQVFPDGYKLEVENPHKPMKSLSEVLGFFVETSGRVSTSPMLTNDYNKLGLPEEDHDHNYRNFIQRASRDEDSGEDTLDSSAQSRTLPREKTAQSRHILQQSKTINVPGGRHVSLHLRPGVGTETYQGPPDMPAPPPPAEAPAPKAATPLAPPAPPAPPAPVALPTRHLENPPGAGRMYVNIPTARSTPNLQSQSQNELQAAVANLKPVSSRSGQQQPKTASQANLRQNSVPTAPSPPTAPAPPPPAPSQQNTASPLTSSSAKNTRSKSPIPPPLPGNHPPPLKPVNGGVKSPPTTPTTPKSPQQKTNGQTPEVASKPKKLPNGISFDFIQHLEQTLPGAATSPPPTSKQAPGSTAKSMGQFSISTTQSTNAKGASPQQKIAAPSQQVAPPQQTVQADDEVYDSIDHYCNHAVINQSQKGSK